MNPKRTTPIHIKNWQNLKMDNIKGSKGQIGIKR